MTKRMTEDELHELMSSLFTLGENTSLEVPQVDEEIEEAQTIDIDELKGTEAWQLSDEHLEGIEDSWGILPGRWGGPVLTAEQVFEYWDEFKKALDSELHWDRAAWYQPFHSYPHDWGIYIKQDAIIKLAARMARFIPENISPTPETLCSLVKLAWLSFFHHEYFHHKIESFATWAEVVAKKPVYTTYKKQVYVPTIESDSSESKDRNIEEALANVEILREVTVKKIAFVDDSLVKRGRQYIAYSFGHSPGGYRRAQDYVRGRDSITVNNVLLKRNSYLLMSQILEGKLEPAIDNNIWENHPIQIGPIFSHSDIPCWTVVPKKTRSIFPDRIAFKRVSSKELVRIMKRIGEFEVVSRRGKGSHIYMKRNDGKAVTIPNKKAPGIKAIKDALAAIDPQFGLNQIPDLLKRC